MTATSENSFPEDSKPYVFTPQSPIFPASAPQNLLENKQVCKVYSKVIFN